MSELYEDLLWFRQMDNEMEDFLKSCGTVEGHGTVGKSSPSGQPSSRRSGVDRPSRALQISGDSGSEYQASPAGLRITEAPEPHEPTKVLGWLLVGFAGFCVYVLGATIFKFWPVIVRTLR
jgi:hypothetical protein